SPNGRFVAFTSASSNLVTDDDNGATDLFVYDASTGAIHLVTEARGGAMAGGTSSAFRVLDDGTVYYQSTGGNIAASEGNGTTDLFLWRPDTIVSGQAFSGGATNDFLLGNAGADTLNG